MDFTGQGSNAKNKPGVRIHGLRSEALLGIQIAHSVFQFFGLQCVLTSVTEGTHGRGSKHFSGNAFDLRSRHVPEEERDTITESLREALGKDFDVVFEGNHWHVEYDPKNGVNQ